MKIQESMVFDYALIVQFIKKLTLPFEKWTAFKLGIIDKDGKILKKRSTLTSIEEKNALTLLDLLILNLKKLIVKFPGGQTSLMNFFVASFLVKESKNIKELCRCNEDILYENLADFYDEVFYKSVKSAKNLKEHLSNEERELFVLLNQMPKTFVEIAEDEIENSVNTGEHVAGLTEPVVNKIKSKKYKEMKK